MNIETLFNLDDHLWCLAKRSNRLQDVKIIKINVNVSQFGIFVEYETLLTDYIHPVCKETSMKSPDGDYEFFTDKSIAIIEMMKNGNAL